MKNHLIISLLFLSVGFSQRLSEVIETYDNGNIKSITYHKKTRNGIEKVKEERYHEYGQKEREGTYKYGKKNGLWTYWDENGKKLEEGTFEDGKKEGKWTGWYQNGKKRWVSSYKDGKLELETGWYENGQKEIEWIYKYGKDFSRKCWDEDGNECDSHHIPHIIIHHTLSH